MASVCASIPWQASTSRTTPSHAARLRRHLVAEVDVARRVDQVEDVALPVDPDVLRLDRDAALALEVHRVEVLRAHVARVDRAGQLEDAVGEGRLAVVDVGDDREVADASEVHGLSMLPMAPTAFLVACPGPFGLEGLTSWRTSRARRSATSPTPSAPSATRPSLRAQDPGEDGAARRPPPATGRRGGRGPLRSASTRRRRRASSTRTRPPGARAG